MVAASYKLLIKAAIYDESVNFKPHLKPFVSAVCYLSLAKATHFNSRAILIKFSCNLERSGIRRWRRKKTQQKPEFNFSSLSDYGVVVLLFWPHLCHLKHEVKVAGFFMLYK